MQKTIRVLHIVQRMEAGGTQALLMNIYRNIDRNKVQFDFLVEYPNKEFYDEEIENLGGKIFYTNVRNDLNIYKFKKELKKIIKENDYKIVHVHTYSIGYFCLSVAKKCGVKIRIAHSHNNETVRDFKYLPKLILQKIYTKYATDLFACSEEAGKYLFKNKKFVVLKNAIDSEKFIYNETNRKTIRKELGLENAFVIGHVGRLHAQKNHKFLLKVFKQVKNQEKNAKLLLIGNGPLEKEIKDEIGNLNLENDVIWLGNRNNMELIYMSMDVFVFPSLFEGLGIVSIEAQAAGLPVVCADTLPKIVEITPNLKKLSLDDSIEEWAKMIIEFGNKKIDKNTQDYIIKSGFDLKNIVVNLEKFYIQKYKE